MALTAAQVALFYKNPDKIAILRENRTQLKDEGIHKTEDRADFDEELISKISDSLRRLRVSIPHLTPGAISGATIPTSPFSF